MADRGDPRVFRADGVLPSAGEAGYRTLNKYVKNVNQQIFVDINYVLSSAKVITES